MRLELRPAVDGRTRIRLVAMQGHSIGGMAASALADEREALIERLAIWLAEHDGCVVDRAGQADVVTRGLEHGARGAS